MRLDGWSALILAGGAGRRFGGGKLLAHLAGQPVIRRTVSRVASTGFADLVVVTGADEADVRAALDGIACRFVHAPDWAEGMAASLRYGVAALAPDAAGVVVFLGDMPLAPVNLCPALCSAAARSGWAARPSHAGQPGHPVAFTQAAFADLLRLAGDEGARAVPGQQRQTVLIATDDRGALLDIDSPGDLADAERAWKACATSATSDNATSRGALPKP